MDDNAFVQAMFHAILFILVHARRAQWWAKARRKQRKGTMKL
jgi:hypothetical protein